MKRQFANKGFTMVELIIVMAIMAILIGVLAPTYLRYVERTKYTTDCSNVGAILDACEVLSADPDVKWLSGEENKITIIIDTNETGHESSYSSTTTGVVTALEEMIASSSISLDSNWGPFTIYAIRGDDGHVVFDISDNNQITQFAKYSEALSGRLE